MSENRYVSNYSHILVETQQIFLDYYDWSCDENIKIICFWINEHCNDALFSRFHIYIKISRMSGKAGIITTIRDVDC